MIGETMRVWDRKGEGAALWQILLSVDDDIRSHYSIEQLRGMQNAYLKANTSRYSTEEIRLIQRKMDALLDKFYMFSLWLEQMQRLSHAHKEHVRKTGNPLQLSTSEQFILRSYLDATIFEARAFMDFLMFYILLVLKAPISPNTHMKSKTFRKLLERMGQDTSVSKPNAIQEILKEHKIFEEENSNWFKELKGLRDKVAHRDSLKASFEGRETVVHLEGQKREHVTFDWLTIGGVTFDRLCQKYQNEIFVFLIEISQILFEIEWKPGPYVSGMFEE